LEANPDYGLVYSDIQMIDDNKVILDTKFYKLQKTKYKSGNIFFDLLQGNFINTLTVCVRADLIKPLAETAKKHNLHFVYDYWFWLNISLKTKIKYVDEKLANYRVHDAGISRQPGFLQERLPHVYYNVLSDYLVDINIKDLSSKEKDILFHVFYFLSRNNFASNEIKKWARLNMLIFRPSLGYISNKLKRKFSRWK